MATRERPIDRGHRLARSDLQRIGTEIRTARVTVGHSLEAVGQATGLSASQVGRIERACLATASVDQLARVGAAVGLDIRVRAFAGPEPTRDGAQVALLERLRVRLHPSLRMQIEVPLAVRGDQRAWDAWIDDWIDGSAGADGLPVEAETRIVDLQAQVRRVMLKTRDAGCGSVLLLLADTTRNHEAIRSAHDILVGQFPVSPRTALAALGAGSRPGGSAIVFL